jgi:oxygen-independent coproporphyrinogen-3 oxidase
MPTQLPVVDSQATPEVTPELLRRHDRPCPRYTSYPTADRFSSDFGPTDYSRALARADAAGDAPLALYTHLPFCSKMCAYCGCTVVVSNSEDKKTGYLDLVLKEIDMVVDHLPSRRRVSEIHLGGGTPNAYPPEELARLMAHIEERFEVEPDAERAVEVDPRYADADFIHELADVGFTRLSYGVQDFNPQVQEAIGRVQSYAKTKEVVDAARAAGFRSVNVDLIYGLPYQTRDGFASTIEQAMSLSPDRVALFSFAHVPNARPNQRRIDVETLPDADTKLDLFCDARRTFLDGGWVAIGMDHFARPEDPLAQAQAEGQLGRNFQGYTVGRGTDLIGFGMSAIGDIGGAYVQSPRRLADWQKAIEAGKLATFRGWRLSPEDEARRWIIRELMCGLKVRAEDVESRFGGSFKDDYAFELDALKELEGEGFVEVSDTELRVTPLGRLFVRPVASAFDTYLRADEGDVPYSRTI